MKRIIIAVALAAALLLLAACDTTVTQHARNHRYAAGEAIEIIDFDSGETLGVLTITGAALLHNAPFEVQLRDEIDGEDQYNTVTETFHQIVQIYFTYTGDRRILNTHFTVRDQNGETAQRPSSAEPWSVQFTEIPRSGEGSFVVALRNASSFVDIEYRFSMWQLRPTAQVRVDLSGAAAMPPPATTIVSIPTLPITAPTTTMAPPATIEIIETEPMIQAPVEIEPPTQPNGLGFPQGIAVGLAVAVVLAGLLIIIISVKKRKAKEHIEE